MSLALLAGLFFLTDRNGVRFLFAIMMAVVYFAIGAVPALATFYLSRRILRTRFSSQNKTEAGNLEL